MTTVMINSIPCHYTERDVEMLLEIVGLSHAYDRVLVPWAPSGESNWRCAYVNFIETSFVYACYQRLDSRNIDGGSSADVITVHPVVGQRLEMGSPCTSRRQDVEDPRYQSWLTIPQRFCYA
mmetsp:Transcript_35573/g.90598  ORF Transcript_35573/g.90598 Transcript_35573/m.90598 type:complete len:122 (+) Transcript_35573:1-366(+)|eukprot:CAMPEP_0115331004 /NCGR_PEP_ID=MMETSP0270-20121206/86080_1 /TAXON_ID=71861 /ORGANISM="Scrippsiella trochoidea, Strain CCMP3099" /LENGTH=121 /DNA_ID=CAMNT_0002751759 /DNA_START=117 /DNA_END=482 /DNA_ORIENTATION=+